MDSGFVSVAGEEVEGFAALEGGGEAVGAGGGVGGDGWGFFDGDPGVGGCVQDLETRRVTDDERKEAEIFVFFGVDGGFGAFALRTVVSEHAELGGGFGGGKGGAGLDEGLEGVGFDVEGVGYAGHDVLHQGAGEIPGDLELVVHGCRTAV